MSIIQQSIDKAFGSYLVTALWSSTDDNGQNLDDNYSINDISGDSLCTLKTKFEQFYSEALSLVIDRFTDEDDTTELTLGDVIDDFDGHEFDGYERLGHDFWLTQNGHGAGFWDGDWDHDGQGWEYTMAEKLGDRLTTLAKQYGEIDLYVGDDGKIYSFPG